MNKYITLSLELHLFFLRIMKEHAIFLETGFACKDKKFIDEADKYKSEIEKLLLDVVNISNGYIRPQIMNSGEIVTEYTMSSETETERLTGVPINKDITSMEINMLQGSNYLNRMVDENVIHDLNNRALNLVNGLITFKESILNELLSCNKFAATYPLLIDHILREAKLYRNYIIALENGQDIDNADMKESELFWNQIMMEHALFIRGLLDPTEGDLINISNNFANDYQKLLGETKLMTDATMVNITNKTLQETLKYRDFKKTGTEGLNGCKIKSMILPLLADHVLREANHYIRILRG